MKLDDDDDEAEEEEEEDQTYDMEEDEGEDKEEEVSGKLKKRISWRDVDFETIFQIRKHQVEPYVNQHGAKWARHMKRGAWSDLYDLVKAKLKNVKFTAEQLTTKLRVLEGTYKVRY